MNDAQPSLVDEEGRRAWGALPSWMRAGILLVIGLAGGGGTSSYVWAQITKHDHEDLSKGQGAEVLDVVDRRIDEKLEPLRQELASLRATSERTGENVMRLLVRSGVEPVPNGDSGTR